jgi:DNA-binding NtrC family response regulator
MIKRVVILQDEQLVIREIERNIQRVSMLAAAPAYAAAGVAPAVAPMPPLAYAPPTPAIPEVETADDPDKAEEPADSGSGSLATVAKAAAMKAERVAIEHTLRQVHWNRRKAAQSLGVSYKTLLNKIKECGISRA